MLLAGGDKHGPLTPEQQLQALMQRLGLDPDELIAATAAAAGEDLPPGVGPEPPDKETGARAGAAAAAAGEYPGYYYDPYYGWVPYPADHPAAPGTGTDNNAPALGQQQQQQPSPEPPPPGCEEEWAAAAEAAAASAYANAYGYGYDGYGGYGGSYDGYGGYGDAAFDPLSHMTEEEYAAYIGDSGPAGDESGAAAADGGGTGDKEKSERKRPAVVQVISLDPMEIER